MLKYIVPIISSFFLTVTTAFLTFILIIMYDTVNSSQAHEYIKTVIIINYIVLVIIPTVIFSKIFSKKLSISFKKFIFVSLIIPTLVYGSAFVLIKMNYYCYGAGRFENSIYKTLCPKEPSYQDYSY